MRPKRFDRGALFYIASLLVFAPVGICWLILQADWQTIGGAYLIWFGVLAIFGFTTFLSLPKGRVAEAIGWPVIFAMFLTVPVIVVLVLILKLAGMP